MLKTIETGKLSFTDTRLVSISKKMAGLFTQFLLAAAVSTVAATAFAANGVAQYDPFTQDPVIIDSKFPPLVNEVTFDSQGVELYGKIFSAQGKGAHPTILIARGYPDMTSSADIALLAQRAGYNAMIFNYRGAWGMKGEFSLENSYQDLQAALAFLRSYSVSQNMHVDPNNIVLLGYSLGGPIVLRLAATDKHIRGVLQLDGLDLRIFPAFSPEQKANWESGFTTLPIPAANGKKIVNEVQTQFNDSWNPANYAAGLAGKDVTLVWAKQGNGRLAHVKERVSLQELYGKQSRLTEKTLETDHDFSNSRIALGRTTLDWLKKVQFVSPGFAEKKEAPMVGQKITLPVAELNKYTGTYQGGSFFKAFIKVDGETLVEADGDQNWLPVIALSGDKFFVNDEKHPGCNDVRFDKNDKGEVVSLVVNCSGRSLTMPRISRDLLFPRSIVNKDLPQAMLEEYAGKYRFLSGSGEPGGLMEVSVSGKNLGAQPEGDVKDTLYAEAEDKFFCRRLEFSFEFLRNEKGQVYELKATHTNGQVVRLAKI
ncbi:hypothetical protein ACO0LF_19165 [Undibacterium sp. Di27W]|uniref:hypothetical protein n=1 Tax=Undibacterium sp. Di27W TaxID=3413036 RepID=UPI003BF3C04E